MAIDVVFYKVAKRRNSTYVPNSDNAYVTLPCNLKDDCGVVSPIIMLASGLTWNPNGVNYCHIEVFGRYYWINEWKYEKGLWVCYCDSDPLASWRDTISSTNYYILRTSQAYDGNIIDKSYPFYPMAETNVIRAEAPLWAFEGDITAGSFVIGIVGRSGIASYYAMNSAGFNTLCVKMFSNIDWMKATASDWGDVKDDIIKSVVNPAQYVTSVMWFPAVVSGEVSPINIPVGWWEISGVRCTEITGHVLGSIHVSVDVPSHPQASSRGNYLNSFPYRRVKIRIGGFGVCEIDPNKISNGKVDVAISYDKRTGNAVCYVYSNNMLLANIYGMVGVPVAISDIQQNLSGAILNGAMTVFNTFTGNVGAGLSSLTGMVSDIATIDVNQISSQGGVASLGSSVTVYTEAHEIVPEDNDRNGRPYCRIGNMKALGSGYYKMLSGETSCLGASPDEIEVIQKTLEGGIYYA